MAGAGLVQVRCSCRSGRLPLHARVPCPANQLLRTLLHARAHSRNMQLTRVTLYRLQVMEVLSSLGTLAPDSMRLTETHMRAMFAAIDVDESGTVDW